MRLRQLSGLIALAFASTATPPAGAQLVIQDTLTGASSSLDWNSFSGACLTAGNNTGKIPACVGLPYYSGQAMAGGFTGKLPDPVGSGALRLTNGAPYYNQSGAVVSNFTYPSGQGIQVTFSTVTYAGDSGGAARDGADGISFFLMDGSQPAGLGAFGGSLGYSCSNSNPPYNGLAGAYIAVGIDEFGNFLNQGDNTATGYGYVPQRIGLRGAGSISWAALTATYPTYYPSTLTSVDQQTAVQQTCATGMVYDAVNKKPTSTPILDYPAIPDAYAVVNNLKTPAGTPVQIANEAAVVRGDATIISYQLKITQDGLLTFAYSVAGGTFQPVITNQSIAASNGPMPDSFKFGFAAATGGSNNIHEILCFKAAPADLAASSAALNTQKSGQLNTGTQVYLAYFHPTNWWGQLVSKNLVYTAATDTVSISSTANWDASCVLTGGACTSTGATTGTAQAPANRSILTWNGTQGVGLQFSNLTTAQQTAIDAGDPLPFNANRVNYLRGDRTNEVNSAGVGLYRARTSVLGDIYNSSPTWVGPPTSPYGTVWKDNIYKTGTHPENAAGAQTYPTFATTNGGRVNVVYAGANDGLLHGFRTGAYDSAGNYISTAPTPNDGQELLAYMPAAVVQTIHNSTTADLDYSSTLYSHAYSVDGTPHSNDLFYGGSWHTWLVGGLGSGGAGVYALDVTDPTRFSEANASSLVIGDWTPSTITCANVASCGTFMGNTFGTPIIRRLHNGNWGMIFGNGFGSTAGGAGIFIMIVDSTTGKVTSTRFLDTGYGPSLDPAKLNSKNGIAFVTPVDLDGDHITDYVYAGDLFGNVWRFDLTSNNPAQWGASSYGGTGASPLFSTPSGQPITTKLMVAAVPAAVGPERVVIDFGTGKTTPQTSTSPTQYAPGTQSLYGIWDWNLSAWNSFNLTQYSVLAAPQSATRASLTAQTVVGTPTSGTNTYRAVSNNPVCWKGSSTCASANTAFGWVLDLPAGNEQVIYSPILSDGAFIVNTTIPPSVSTICSDSTPTGFTMAISPATGGTFPTSFFADANNKFVPINGLTLSGIQLNATGSPTVVSANSGRFLVTQTTTGSGATAKINPQVGGKGKRLTWIEKR